MEEEKGVIHHKIEPNRPIMVWKTTTPNDKVFYKVLITQENYDQTKDKFYVNLVFKKGVVLENQTKIIIKKAYENYRKNEKDPYNGISYLMVTDFEIVGDKEREKEQALDKFRDTRFNNENNDNVYIDDNFLD